MVVVVQKQLNRNNFLKNAATGAGKGRFNMYVREVDGRHRALALVQGKVVA
jgi:hypothetical protein